MQRGDISLGVYVRTWMNLKLNFCIFKHEPATH